MFVVLIGEGTAQEKDATQFIAVTAAAQEAFGKDSFESRCASLSPATFLAFIERLTPDSTIAEFNHAFAQLAEDAMNDFRARSDKDLAAEAIEEWQSQVPQWGLREEFNRERTCYMSKVSKFKLSHLNARESLDFIVDRVKEQNDRAAIPGSYNLFAPN